MATINPIAAPTDYIGAMSSAQNPGSSMLDGLRNTAAIREMLKGRREEKAAAELQRQYSTDLQQALANPTAQNFAALQAKYPDQREAFKTAYDTLDKDQKDSEYLAGVQVFSAISSGKPEIAKQLLQERITAAQNSGKPTARLDAMAKSLEASPDLVRGQLGLVLSSIDPQKWSTTTVQNIDKSNIEVGEAESKALKAAVDAKYADSLAAKELALKGIQIDKLALDMNIAKQNASIAAMNAAASAAENPLKRQELELKVKKAKYDLDNATRTVATDLSNKASAADMLITSTEDLLSLATEAGTPIDKKTGLPYKFTDSWGRATGPISTKFPTFSEDTANIEEAIKPLQSQIVLSKAKELTGVLSDSDVALLSNSLASLSLRQSPERLYKNLQTIKRLTLQAREKLTAQGAPAIVGNANAPANAGAEDAYTQQYGGAQQ